MEPLVICSEMADNAVNINGGRDMQDVIDCLQVKYVVYSHIISVWEYGENSHRKRLLLFAFRRDFKGAHSFTLPQPLFDAQHAHTARDTAVADEDVPADHWIRGCISRWYQYAAPVAGKIHRIGRVAAGMGHSSFPHLLFSFEGANNGPTTKGSGGSKPQ